MCLTCSLDQLLDSGLYTGEVTELMGAPGSGKTQVSETEERGGDRTGRMEMMPSGT